MSRRRSARGSSAPPGVRSEVGEKRGVVLALALVFLALLIAFSALGLSSRSDSRRQSEQRFAGEAALSARLTSALLSSSVAGSEAAAAKALGGPSLSSSTLDALATQSHLAYVLVLDQSGKVIASSSGPAAAARAKTIGSQTHVRHALAGQPWLSDILPPPPSLHQNVLEWALPFNTSSGRRVEIEALDPNLLSGFFGTYLRQLQQTSGGAAFILDSGARVLGSGSGTVKTGDRPTSTALLAALAKRPSGFYDFDGSQRYYSSSAVAGTTWRVVMGIRTSALFPALAGSESWFLYAVLAAFALAGGISVLLFHRSLRAGAALRQSNASLVALNATLEERVAERTAAAEERATELGRSNAELEQFSSIASHDLQEPLRKIRMFGDRLRERLGTDLPPEPAADLDRIESAAGRMQHLINDLLDFSRVNHRGNAFEAVDLGELTGEVAADLEARIVELDARVDDRRAWCRSRPTGHRCSS